MKYLRLVGQGQVVVGYYPVSLPRSGSNFSVPLDKPIYMALTRVDLVDVDEPPVGAQAPKWLTIGSQQVVITEEV